MITRKCPKCLAELTETNSDRWECKSDACDYVWDFLFKTKKDVPPIDLREDDE